MNQINSIPVSGGESGLQPNQEIGQSEIISSPESVIQSTPENTVSLGAPNDPAAKVVQTPEVLVDNTNFIEEPTSDVIKNEIKEENSSKVDSSDNAYIKKVKNIIKQDAERPYNELENAEELEISYLRDRFGVSVKEEEN